MPTAVVIVSWVGMVFFAGWAIYLKGHANRVHKTDEHDGELREMRDKIRLLELDMARQQSPLMKQVQDLLSAGLHHPDPSHSRQDFLLEQLDKTTLTLEQKPELVAFLDKQIANPATPLNELEAAKALKAIMPLVVKERAAVVKVEQSQEKP